MASSLGQRSVGGFLLLIGGGGTGWIWHTVLTEGYYYFKASILFPVVAVFGLGLLLFPLNRDELRARWGVEKIESVRQVPRAWWLIAILALVCGFGNLLLLLSL